MPCGNDSCGWFWINGANNTCQLRIDRPAQSVFVESICILRLAEKNLEALRQTLISQGDLVSPAGRQENN